MTPRVCIYGDYDPLLQIRMTILHGAGFKNVLACRNSVPQLPAPDIAVLCNSLDFDQQVDLAKYIAALDPRTRVVAIINPTSQPDRFPPNTDVIFNDPAELVAICRRLAAL